MVLLELGDLKKKIVAKKLSNSGVAKAKNKAKEYVVIDYPMNGDKILPYSYTIRVGASGGPVEISIDGQSWVECRQNQGYYWHDWNSITLGEHACVARLKTPSGKFKKSKEVRCTAVENIQN